MDRTTAVSVGIATRRRRKLFSHQKAVLNRIKDQSAVALFLQMRLGKTLIAIRWAVRFPAPRLVVAPLSVLDAWQEELAREGQRSVILTGQRRLRLVNFLAADVSWALINYEGLFTYTTGRYRRWLPSSVARYPWRVVILDESVRIRNPRTRTARVCVDFLGQAPYRAVLSGLPNPESTMDFFEQLRFVDGEFLGYRNFWQFRQRCFVREHGSYRWVPTLQTVRRAKRAVRQRAVVLSRKQVRLDNCILCEDRYVVLPKAIARTYERVQKDFALGSEQTNWRLGVYNWMLRLTGGRAVNRKGEAFFHDAKLAELKDLLTTELKNEKVLIWFTFLTEGDAIQAYLARHRRVALIRGDCPLEQRRVHRQAFIQGELDTLCLQCYTSRYGLDFSAASTAIYYSIPPSLDTYQQSLDRMVHPSKKEPLLAIHLLAKDTVDVHIRRALADKDVRYKAILGRIRETL